MLKIYAKNVVLAPIPRMLKCLDVIDLDEDASFI